MSQEQKALGQLAYETYRERGGPVPSWEWQDEDERERWAAIERAVRDHAALSLRDARTVEQHIRQALEVLGRQPSHETGPVRTAPEEAWLRAVHQKQVPR